MNEVLRATVLIPARNEAGSIERCLERVLAQDLPAEQLQVIVVDGDSTDGTGDVARRVLSGSRVGIWSVRCNSGGATPSNLNVGLRHVLAPVVCRIDARSLVPSHYVRRCCEVLEQRTDVVVTGGRQVAVARSPQARDVGIARALNNRYGMGLSRYRRGASSGPADTVYLGAFRTADLLKAGGWDERFATNQDFELNRRLSDAGLVWFDSELAVEYLPRQTISELFRQYRRFGAWKARYWTMTGDNPRPRQVGLLAVPPLGATAVCLGLVRSPKATLTVVLIAAALIEALGSDAPRSRDPRAHAWSTAALATVGTAWWLGVVRAVSARIGPTPG